MTAHYDSYGWATLPDKIVRRIPPLDCAKSSVGGRSFFARDDRVRVGSTSLVEFDAPTFRKERERWGTPRFWWCLRSTEILRWESLALPRTPLPQDGGGVMKARVGHPTRQDHAQNSLFIPCRASVDAGALDCARSSARGRSFFARDDRVKVRGTAVAKFDAPTFRKGRERWGTPRFWWCRQSAEILRLRCLRVTTF